MAEHAVVIAGGGPTGMMLAAELALAKVDVAIVERRASQELDSNPGRFDSSQIGQPYPQRWPRPPGTRETEPHVQARGRPLLGVVRRAETKHP